MARKQQRPAATRYVHVPLIPQRSLCEQCGGMLWVAYHSVRTITTLNGLCQLLLTVRRCHHFCGADLQPTDIERWYALRDELDGRQQLRRAQYRFRRDLNTYLSDLENKLLLLRLPP